MGSTARGKVARLEPAERHWAAAMGPLEEHLKFRIKQYDEIFKVIDAFRCTVAKAAGLETATELRDFIVEIWRFRFRRGEAGFDYYR